MTKRAALTTSHKEFIIRRLAGFESHRSIRDTFNVIFSGIAISEHDVMAIDPDSGVVVAPELLTLFLSTREAVLLDPTSAPFADQKARLIVLSRQASFYGGNNQPAEQRAVLRQIAEEKGDVGGAKGAAGKLGAGAPAEPIAEIRVTYVDPKQLVEDE